MSQKLIWYAEQNSDSPTPALRQSGVRKETKSRPERKPKFSISLGNEALAEPHGAAGANGAHRSTGSRHLRLLEVAAHDLQNPISGILASIQYLLEDAGGRLDAHHVSLLRSMESSGKLMLQLLQDMLEIPALETVKLQFEFRSIDIGQLVEQAVLANRPLADSNRVNLELIIEKPVPAVVADPSKIEYALNALLVNAILCSRADSKIEVAVGRQADRAVITFRNEGRNLSAHSLEALFDPARGNRRRRGLSEEHAALRLATVKRILEGHGGTLQINDHSNRRPFPTVILPLSQGTCTSQTSKAQRKQVAAPSAKWK